MQNCSRAGRPTSGEQCESSEYYELRKSRALDRIASLLAFYVTEHEPVHATNVESKPRLATKSRYFGYFHRCRGARTPFQVSYSPSPSNLVQQLERQVRSGSNSCCNYFFLYIPDVYTEEEILENFCSLFTCVNKLHIPQINFQVPEKN